MYRRILSLVKPYWLQMTSGVLFSILNVFFQTVTLWLSASFITTIFTIGTQASGADPLAGNLDLNERLKAYTREFIFQGDQLEALRKLALVILIAYILKSLAHYGNALLTGLVRARVIRDLRTRLYDHFLTQPLGFFQKRRSGDLISLAMNDVMRVNQALSTTFKPLVTEPLYLISYLSLLFIIDVKLTLISLLVIPVTTFFIVTISRSIRRKVNRVQKQLGEITSRYTELFNGIRIIKAFVNERQEEKRFHQEAGRLYKLMLRLVQLSSLSLPVTELLGVIMAVFLLWMGGVQVIKYQAMTNEDFIRFIVLLFAIYQPIRNLARVNVNIQIGIAAGARVFRLLDVEPTIQDLPDGITLGAFQKELRFQDVSFAYPDSDMAAVEDINVVISKGAMVALVGPSGAGKSTFVDLIPRFHDIDRGTITIDGHALHELTRSSLRAQIGIVSQDTILFNDTVHHNIAYGTVASHDAVAAAAAQANAHEFIQELPEKYDTVLGEHGSRLSGGQKQRIAIARALLKDPAILILDEATSALDTESERQVQSAVDRLMQGRTVIVIAHRLSTILNADEILVLDQGRIVERGSHAELKAAGGLYEKLYRLQFKDEAGAANPAG